MSTLRTDTLSNAAGSASVPVNTVVNGTAKAWVNFNGTGTVAIRQAFNVTSITDNGVGDYTVNFTNAMADANYSILATGQSSTGAYNVVQQNVSTTQTTSAVRLASLAQSNNTPTASDSAQVTAAVFR